MDGRVAEISGLTHVVAALNENPEMLAEKMGISCEAVIVNQCGEDRVYDFTRDGRRVHVINSSLRGVGNSRNTGLLNVTTPYILIGDEDIVYAGSYAETVVSELEKHREADVLLFNVSQSDGRYTYHTDSFGRVRFYNAGRYPAYSIAMRTDRQREANVWFSLLFGGGAKYAAGEDSLFLMDCLRKGLKVYRTPAVIGQETTRESTWFKGFDDKFFHDRGRLYRELYRGLAPLFGLYFLIKKRGEWLADRKFGDAWRLMREGMR